MGRPFYTSNMYHVCYACEVRHVGCHAECQLYLDEKKKADEHKEKAYAIKRNEYITQSNNKSRQKEAIKRWYRKYGV